jgi:CRP/FNR family cyclic AMP-dependent transcriptional regulator
MGRGIPTDVLRKIQGVPLFASVSKQGLRWLAQAADEVPVTAGRTILREGETGQELYVILEGTAQVTRNGRKLADLGPGGFVGELAFLDHAPRSASVSAVTDVRVLVLGPQQFGVILEHEPRIALPMLKTLGERIRRSEQSFTH